MTTGSSGSPGRSDDMLKVGGIWVSPAEIEHLLMEHPAVQACGVTGRRGSGSVNQTRRTRRAPAPARPDAELVAALQQLARQRLSEYKRPRWFEFVDALPLTATGKVQRFKLRLPHAIRQLNGCLKSIPAASIAMASGGRLEAARRCFGRNPTRATATAVSMTGGTRTFADWMDRLVLLQLAAESAPHCLLHERIRASGLAQACSPDYCRRGTEPCIHHASCSPASRCQEPMDDLVDAIRTVLDGGTVGQTCCFSRR